MKVLISLACIALMGGCIINALNVAPFYPGQDPVGTVVRTVTFEQCTTYILNPVFAALCPLPAQGGPDDTITVGDRNVTLAICDSHCRCTHGAQYGECIERPPTGPNGTPLDVSNLTCKCYYSAPPPGLPTNNNILDSSSVSPITLFGSAYCAGWNLTPFAFNYVRDYCALVSNGGNGTGNCNADCVCVHQYDRGDCTDKYCSCSYKDGTQIKDGK